MKEAELLGDFLLSPSFPALCHSHSVCCVAGSEYQHPKGLKLVIMFIRASFIQCSGVSLAPLWNSSVFQYYASYPEATKMILKVDGDGG